MFPDRFAYKFDDSKLFDMPRMFEARQHFVTRRIEDVEGAVRGELDKLALPPLAGKRVALTAGSRGVANQARVLKCAAGWLRGRGAEPFIVPAMGSHGGATAEGQLKLIADFGITEKAMGVPILSSMEVVQFGTTASGYPVFCDRHAFAADYILPVHRVKPHTGFKADLESGLCKMMVIGLGKHKGATNIHNEGFLRFHEILPAAAAAFIGSGKILAGLALVENALDETMLVEAIPAGEIIARERELLAIAKIAMPRILLAAADVLVVEEIGKNISGAGMDPNVTGRSVLPLKFSDFKAHRVVALSLTPESHGNAAGLGLADVTTLDTVRGVDFDATYTNSITAGVLEISRLPIMANTEMDAIRIAICATPKVEPSRARILQIRNTLDLSRIRLSESYRDALSPGVEALSEPAPMRFDAEGALERIPAVHGTA